MGAAGRSGCTAGFGVWPAAGEVVTGFDARPPSGKEATEFDVWPVGGVIEAEESGGTVVNDGESFATVPGWTPGAAGAVADGPLGEVAGLTPVS